MRRKVRLARRNISPPAPRQPLITVAALTCVVAATAGCGDDGKHREEVGQISTTDYVNMMHVIGGCYYDEALSGCTATAASARVAHVGHTGGLSAEFVRTELGMSPVESNQISATCAAPIRPEIAQGTMIHTVYTVSTYTIDKRFAQGGGLASRSAEQFGIEGVGAWCMTIPLEAR